jgi:predicted nucleotidyltransferase component of viral defense system
MSQKSNPKKADAELSLEQIKRIAITAMVADDELFENLVLKGGNALDLIHRLSSRSSLDLDFSMKHDWHEDVDQFCRRVERVLDKTFRQHGHAVFDVKIEEKPNPISPEMASFWGGYAFEFKLISLALYEEYEARIDELRKRALSIGQGKKFLIDVSRFEYTDGKLQVDFDGFRIFVYTPEMILCEKLRAICQQMPEYGSVVKRERAGKARARDFFDIHLLDTKLSLNLTSEQARETLQGMFDAKRVPLSLLCKVEEYREFHRPDFPAVQDTVFPGTKMESFDYYFDHVLGLIEKLKPFWDK